MTKLKRFFSVALIFSVAFSVLLPNTIVQAQTTNSEIYTTLLKITEQVNLLSLQLQLRTNQATTTPIFRRGLSDSKIAEIQESLAEHKELYPEGLVTGYFGEMTEEAVKRLQERKDLPVTGVIDAKTKTALKEYKSPTTATETSVAPMATRNPDMLKLCQNSIIANSPLCLNLLKQAPPTTPITTAGDESPLDPGYDKYPPIAETPKANITYDISYGSHANEVFDLYRPITDTKSQVFPTIIMVHGGGWKRGSKDLRSTYVNKVNYFIPKKYTFISINYPVENIDPEEEVNSVAKAVTFIQKNAEKFGVDRSKIVLMGHSAGAHLVSLLTSDAGIRRVNSVQPWLGTISLDSAGYNIPEMMKSGHYPTIYEPAFGDDPRFWRAMSPYHQYRKRGEAFLLVCSTSRPDKPCEQVNSFKGKVTGLGGSAEALSVDMSHKEINSLLGLPGEYTNNIQKFLTALNLP